MLGSHDSSDLSPDTPRSCLKIKTKDKTGITHGTSEDKCLSPRGTITEKMTCQFLLVGVGWVFSQNPQQGSNLYGRVTVL